MLLMSLLLYPQLFSMNIDYQAKFGVHYFPSFRHDTYCVSLKICILHTTHFPSFEIKARCCPYSSASLPIVRQGCSSTRVSSCSSLQKVILTFCLNISYSLPSSLPFFGGRVPCSPGWPRTVYAVRDDLGLLLLRFLLPR